jgi:hypothetical protein
VAAVERATANFVERGQQIAIENPDIEHEMIQAVEEVQQTGEAMSSSAREFATDPCSSVKRGNMVRKLAWPWRPPLALILILASICLPKGAGERGKIIPVDMAEYRSISFLASPTAQCTWVELRAKSLKYCKIFENIRTFQHNPKYSASKFRTF